MVVGAVLTACVLGPCGCGGGGDEEGATGETAGDDGHEPEGEFAEPASLGPQGIRRMSNAELAATLELIVGMDRTAFEDLLARLPADVTTPFDNDYPTQVSSGPLVDGMFALAEELAERVVGDPTVRDTILGCTPTGPTDETCLRSFIADFGRLMLRRPLDAAEVDRYAAFIDFASAEDDFDVAVRLVIQALLLDGEFLYRVEIGQPVPGQDEVVRLSDFELATRLSFLLWGRGPDRALLDLAESGGLETSGRVLDVAQGLLDDPRGAAQIQRLHALWLGYDNMALEPDLAGSLRRESDALIDKVSAQGNWLALFTSSETFVDARLAEHYDIDLPGGEPGWVSYPDPRRGGLLSHGSFLSVGKKFGDTSPTERGKFVWTRLMCNEIPPPPPTVDSGVPPTGGPADACKIERYDMRTKAECSSCHEIIDSIGFGLENYGPAGEWRTEEPGRPDCFIEGQGEVPGIGPFAGALALGQTVVESGQLEGCFVENFYQFAIGRAPGTADDGMLEALTQKFEERDDISELLLEFAASEGFRHRVIDEGN